MMKNIYFIHTIINKREELSEWITHSRMKKLKLSFQMA